jgi:Flp pilus assembly protein TadD
MNTMKYPCSLRTPVVKRSTAVFAVALSTLVPTRAVAQKDPFIDAFIGFHSMLSGTYGDEGPQVTAFLDQMAASLAEWESATSKAEAELSSRTTKAPSDLALLYVDSGRLDAALSAIEAAIQVEPTRAAFHTLRGLILDATGRHDEAIAALTTAWRLNPADPITAYLLADRRTADVDSDDLQPQLETLLKSYERAAGVPAGGRGRAPFMRLALIEDRAADTPIFSPASYADGFTLIAQGRYQEAIARFREAVSRDPLVADPVARSDGMARGTASLRQGQYTAAIEQLEAVVAASPSSSEAHRILGAAYGANRNHMQSVLHLDTAIRLAPRDERARVALGRELADAGKPQEAEQVLRDAIAVLPSSGQARWALADLYMMVGRGMDAIRELSAASELIVVAGKGQLYWRLAEMSHSLQEYERVVDALSRRARLMPNEAGAHKDLGLAYNRLGRQDHAFVELIMASFLGLEDGETLAVIGQIHLTGGRYTMAEEVLRRAVALRPDSAEARYALGSALLRLGKVDEGKAQLAEFQRLQAAALENQRRTFDHELSRRESNLRNAEPGR